MFAMLLPTTLPTAMSGRLLIAAPTDTTISGAEVPKPTITSPVNKGEMPRRRAAAKEPRITASPPPVSKARPTTRNKTSIMAPRVRIEAASELGRRLEVQDHL